MKVSQWAEIRRLVEVEKLSQRAVAQQLGCCHRTVARALCMDHPPDEKRCAPRGSLLDPYKPKIEALLARYPQLSAARVMEEIRRGPDGYQGKLTLVRIYLRQVRPRRGRVYQEVEYEPGQAMQIDWGHCGQIRIGSTQRKVSVFVAVLCYSRMTYIEFTLSQRKAEFYRAIVNALTFFGGSPRRVIFDNLKAAVLNGSGRHACLHPEFLALCGHFCLEPIACERRDPESKGTVEAGVRYVKRNALAGREDELVSWDDYQQLAVTWRDEVANVRLHHTTRQRPVDRFAQESGVLRPLPGFPFDTDEVVLAIVSSHARVHFDGNRYSVPPKLQNTTVMIRASDTQVRVIAAGEVATCHIRSYDRNQLISLPEHRLEALKLRSRVRAHDIEEAFDALGEEARKFHLELRRLPVKTTVHLRRLLNLVHLYGRQDVVAAIARANQWLTFDAAYVETILLQDRRRRELPSPTQVRPRREELHELLLQNLIELNLTQIAATYREVLDEAARRNSSMLEVLSSLVASEMTSRRHKALQRRILQAKLPKLKTLAEYKFEFPKRIPKQKIVRLFDCEFIEQHQCAILIGPTGTGKTHLMTALGFTACERGITVRFTRVIDMINRLTTAQINGTLEQALKAYLRPSLLLLDELGYLPIDKRGADLLFQVVAARYESGSIVITTNRPFRDWGRIFDVDNTLATAMIDRLMHHGEAMVIQGNSFRTKGDNPDDTKGDNIDQ